MSLIHKAIGALPRPLRRYLRHSHHVVTGKLPRNWHEMSERDDFFRKGMKLLSYNGISGDYAEFGCHGGMTFDLAWRHQRVYGPHRHQWAFDSFEGLPPQLGSEDEHPMWVAGDMSTSEAAFRARARANGLSDGDFSTVKGFYEHTIGDPAYAGPLPTDIAFAYIDCDLYSSTVTVLAYLRTRMKHGMLIAFDDYFCFSSTVLSGERAAMLEFLAADDRFDFAPYQPFGWHGMSFIVEDKALVARHRAGG